MRDVAGEPHRGGIHGEVEDFFFLLFIRRGTVGWAGVVDLLMGC
jgi:hypothetical protein